MNTTKLRKEIWEAINRNSAENGSDTPDFILAEYLTDCLAAFDKAVSSRTAWYGPEPVHCDPPEDSPIPRVLTPEESANITPGHQPDGGYVVRVDMR